MQEEVAEKHKESPSSSRGESDHIHGEKMAKSSENEATEQKKGET